MAASAGQFYQPQAASFSATVGPFMGTKNSGISLRGSSGVPKNINFNDFVTANGGERTPPSTDPASQRIRQLWVLVTNPASTAAADTKEQANEIELIQRFRQEYNRYFYTLTSYKGRVHTDSDPQRRRQRLLRVRRRARRRQGVDTGRGRPSPSTASEEIPNTGGKAISVHADQHHRARRPDTYNGQARPIKISGAMGEVPPFQDAKFTDKSLAAANNLLTVRMRVPNDPALLEDLKAGKEKLFAEIEFTGSKAAKIRIPTDPESFLVPDGRFRNYAVDLSNTAGFRDGEYNAFSFMPSNLALQRHRGRVHQGVEHPVDQPP